MKNGRPQKEGKASCTCLQRRLQFGVTFNQQLVLLKLLLLLLPANWQTLEHINQLIATVRLHCKHKQAAKAKSTNTNANCERQLEDVGELTNLDQSRCPNRQQANTQSHTQTHTITHTHSKTCLCGYFYPATSDSCDPARHCIMRCGIINSRAANNSQNVYWP